MSDVSFQRFIDLVEFDQTTQKLEKELAGLNQHIADATLAVTGCVEQLHEAENSLKRAKLVVKEKEAHMQELDVKQRAKEKSLEGVHNSKEYRSLCLEIDMLKKIQYEYENELIDAWNTLENITQATKVLQENVAQRTEQLRQEIAEKTNACQQLEQQLSANAATRIALLESVPPELLEKYNAIKGRIINPIVPVIQRSCSACHNGVAGAIIARLRSKSLEQCRNCFRFLYLKDHE